MHKTSFFFFFFSFFFVFSFVILGPQGVGLGSGSRVPIFDPFWVKKRLESTLFGQFGGGTSLPLWNPSFSLPEGIDDPLHHALWDALGLPNVLKGLGVPGV